MLKLLDSQRRCSCSLCTGQVVPAEVDAHCFDNTVDLVREYGWSSTGVAGSDGVPAWAYSIGLWHSLGSAEVAMFGLSLPDMQHWVNVLAGQIKDGEPIEPGDTPRHGILPNDFPILLRPVHTSWYPSLFGTAMRFYRRPPMPIVQMIWPDRHGHFPWEPEAGDGCKTNQPWLWLPLDEHPTSFWPELDAITPWPFEDHDIFTKVYTTGRIMDGAAPIRGVVRDEDGDWQFLDGDDVTEEDVRVIHLHHLYAKHPHIAAAARLTAGRQIWRDDDGWHESALD